MNLGKQFKDGMLTQNPVLVQVLGMCSTMAITTSFFNGIGLGVAVTIILTLSNICLLYTSDRSKADSSTPGPSSGMGAQTAPQAS